MRRIRLDPFIVSLLAAALVGSFLPLSDDVIDALGTVSLVGIGLLFFLYGARLSTAETLAGLRNLKLQVLVLVTTFVLFPLLGLASQVLEPSILSPNLAAGVLLLCLVPSTVQSCVTYTRMAGGDTASAVVSASVSNIVGVFLTPLLIAWLMAADADVDAGAILRIVFQLLVPFVLGQLLRPWVGGWVERHDGQLKLYDRGTIVLVVLVAFARAAAGGTWSAVSVGDVLVVVLVCAALLAIAMGWCVLTGRLLRFPQDQRWAILFCGSNKSLASGLRIASVLFPPHTVALIVLPLMIYHQLQLISGSVIASRAARNL